MDTAATHAPASPRQRWLPILLAIAALSSACSNFPRSSPEALSPESQARVAASLEQNPPPSMTRYPRGVPYQPLSDAQKRLLESQVIPRLYNEAPPAASPMAPAEPAPPAPELAAREVAPNRAPQTQWTPYRRLSAEEKAFLQDVVIPQLSPGAGASTASRRTAPTRADDGSVATTPTPARAEQPDEQTATTEEPEATPVPAPRTATAPGPRRDKLDTTTEDLPGPRVEKLESTTGFPVREPVLPRPQAVPDTTAPAPTPRPSAPATPTGEAEPDPPEARFPRAGEAVAAAANPVPDATVEEPASATPEEAETDQTPDAEN